jgi:hypothetical protein
MIIYVKFWYFSLQRYKWNIVESDKKHHKSKSNPINLVSSLLTTKSDKWLWKYLTWTFGQGELIKF